MAGHVNTTSLPNSLGAATLSAHSISIIDSATEFAAQCPKRWQKVQWMIDGFLIGGQDLNHMALMFLDMVYSVLRGKLTQQS